MGALVLVQAIGIIQGVAEELWLIMIQYVCNVLHVQLEL